MEIERKHHLEQTQDHRLEFEMIMKIRREHLNAY
jgi:hypothetical protein